MSDLDAKTVALSALIRAANAVPTSTMSIVSGKRRCIGCTAMMDEEACASNCWCELLDDAIENAELLLIAEDA